jgi:iron complex outermembrane receptor protein
MLTVSRKMMALGGGDLTWRYRANCARFGAHLQRTAGLCAEEGRRQLQHRRKAGNVVQSDLVGETPQGVAKKLKREISSLVMEAGRAVHRDLPVERLGARRPLRRPEKTTVNPALAARWQPVKQLVLRSSVSTGFRAPSIMDIQNPTPEVRTQVMDDPVLCRSSQPTVPAPARPSTGYTADQVCNVDHRLLDQVAEQLLPEA